MSEVDWKAAHDTVLAHHRETFAELRSDIDRVTAERDALQALLTAADERADVLEALLLQTNELLYAIQGDPGAVPSSSIDAMRGRVFEALKPAETEPYQGIPGTSFQRLNALANQGE
ncbi:hypothetical protein QDY63_11160 [Pseudomonas brenneri]|uniref:hypothetical protein n=1 Tax=Pseudomonas brenneri TaxID=129817 RepID=UPI0025A14904|nr:hypothetical protein [Pseudomonas brenneri]WJM93403.1 hypothetical protein QDY63_11160 [Pseudomonas brenneri]